MPVKSPTLLPRRGARTHSENYTWDDLKAEAFGEMDMLPWNFYRMTFEEFHLKRKGLFNLRVERLHEVRLICFFAASGNLKKGTRIEQLFPLPGDKNYNKKITAERYKELKSVIEKMVPPELPKRTKNVSRAQT